MNTIELAKSGRSSCRSCKQKIEKDDPRLGVEIEMTRGENTFTAKQWHHLDCAIDKLPEEVIIADIETVLPDDYLDKLEKLKEKLNKSGFTVIGISELEEPNVTVNTQATILRPMNKRVMNDYNDEEREGRTIYVEHEEQRRKIILWGDFLESILKKNDTIVVINGITNIGADEKIQVNTTTNSRVLINPAPEELEKYSGNIELYMSNSWSRPSGTKVLFEYAKSARAICPICENKIDKGILKLVKPAWRENEKTKRRYSGNYSFHVICAIEDEHGEELIHEALTRVTPDLFNENHDIFIELNDHLPQYEGKNILDQLLP
ncbi:MAG: hypothetical protein ACXAD7_11535 [Candidatus Kariarchaeaceae archaeon]|jgi:hypothetical protein